MTAIGLAIFSLPESRYSHRLSDEAIELRVLYDTIVRYQTEQLKNPTTLEEVASPSRIAQQADFSDVSEVEIVARLRNRNLRVRWEELDRIGETETISAIADCDASNGSRAILYSNGCVSSVRPEQ